MITVTATQQVIPGREAELDALMAALARDVRAHEPGCLRFDYIRSDTDPSRRMVVEVYRDDVALAAHRTTPYLAAFIPELMTCLVAFPEVSTFSDVFEHAEPPSFFHVGIVVTDLGKAAARYSEVLGVEFTEPGTFSIPRLEDPHPHPFELTAVMSRTEPPYYELIQADGDGIVSAANAGQILYYGVWEPDMAGRLRTLARQGVGVDALFRMDEHSEPFAAITAPDLDGARIEYVGAAAQTGIEDWVRTGVLAPGIGA
jgi:quinol monooxygenase YgiN/catechol 2,3-dioxygenase-like lactoylglutathione lyase family enzyme